MGPKVLFSVRTAARSRATHARMSNCLIPFARARCAALISPSCTPAGLGLESPDAMLPSAPQVTSTTHISPQGGFTGSATALMRAAPRMRQRAGAAEGGGGLAEEARSFE